MATYDSVHTGEQVDQAVDIVLGNKGKGSTETPVYLNGDGVATSITKATNVTQNDSKLITSGAAFTGLSFKYNKADIVVDPNLGTSNVLIPSCGAVKTYVDKQVATKQVPVSAGDNVNITNNVISVVPSDDMITMKELDNKWSHFGNLDVGENSDVLEKMKEAKHSAYVGDQPDNSSPLDPKKFTYPNGHKPTITEDGIISNMDGTQHLNNLVLTLSNSFDITISVVTEKTFTTTQELFIAMRPKPNTTKKIFDIRRYGTGSKSLMFHYRDSNDTYSVPEQAKTSTSTDTKYTFRIVKKESSLKMYVNGTLHLDVSDCINTEGEYYIYLYNDNNEDYLQGYADLKDISIKDENGIEIFSGCKTGMDVLKPIANFDYYTKILAFSDGNSHTIYANNSTTPTRLFNQDGSNYTGSDFTISENTVYYGETACTRSSSNDKTITTFCDACVTVNDEGYVLNTSNNTLDAYIKMIPPELYATASSWHLQFNTAWSNIAERYVTFQETSICQVTSSTDWTDIFLRLYDSSNTEIFMEVRGTNLGPISNVLVKGPITIDVYYSDKVGYWFTVTQNGVTHMARNGGVSNTNKLRSTKYLFQTANPKTQPQFDLNSLKFWADDELVFQGCLKVPYTQSIDGKKIVDEMYRDRVEDEYIQAGYTPYYTLQSEDKGDYNVIGSPTISSDFVASGFSSNNYLKAPSVFSANTKLEVLSPVFSWTNITSGYQTVFEIGTTTNTKLALLVFPDGVLHYAIAINNVNILNLSMPISTNTKYQAKYLWENNTYKIFIKTENGDFVEKGSVSNSTKPVCSTSYLNIGANLTQNNPSIYGSIDLKDFKIYVDNKLSYQAVIPSNYTMATVKPSDIIDSYDNGVTKWTKYADLTLKQTGSWTAGSAVTFDKKFRDTNYAITVPYTSGTKLATGFTPSAASGAGDWVAIGKTTLN